MKYEFDWSNVTYGDVVGLFVLSKSTVVGAWACGLADVIAKACPGAMELPITEWRNITDQFFTELYTFFMSPGELMLTRGTVRVDDGGVKDANKD